MFVRTTSTPNSPRKSVKVVESVREGYKVKQVMLHHLGVGGTTQEIEKLKRLGQEFIVQESLRREQESPQRSLFEPMTQEEKLAQIERLEALKQGVKKGRKPKVVLKDVTSSDLVSLSDLVEESRVVEGIHDVAGHVYDLMGYDALLTRIKDKELLKDLVLMRLSCPSSKLKAKGLLDKRFNKTHDIDSIYRVMDKLLPKIDTLKTLTFQNTKSIIPEVIDLLFFDCTTLYFESTDTDDLRKFGFSKDHRFNTTQVVLALATNSDGLPIGYELFEGSTAEVKTLLICITKWKQHLSIGEVCFVADRAMMSDANLTELESEGHSYVIAAKLRSMPKLLQQEILSEENYNITSFGSELGWVGEFEYSKRRLIVSYKTKRAHNDAYKRDKVIEKISKRIGGPGASGDTQKLITNHGVKKYTESTDSQTILSQDKIDNDSLWDGLHGIITNIPAPKLSEKMQVVTLETIEIENLNALYATKRELDRGQDAVTLLSRYSHLWKIEESFRINKHTLSMRPIYHFKPERIKSHIAICYMAFSVLRHMEYKVKLTQKISPEVLLDELKSVEASIYRHLPTNRLYRMPGKFTHNASKIYKTFQIDRRNHAQELTYNKIM